MAEPTKAVFLSYASQDATAARKICETLRSSGVEVWCDVEGGLEHGDEWDAKIRRQIKECVLFLPLISANTQARLEGYFRIEWDFAAERARGIASGVPFILPVVIDDTGEPGAHVPDRFRAVQWTRLPGGAVPPDVLARFLKLWGDRTGVAKAVVVPATSAATHHPLASAAPSADDKSIAVLPFANMSADAENEYFSDGMTEEIINALVQVPDLRVAARTSVFAFKGKADDLRTIAAKLNVRTVLEGSVRKAGNKIRITAQLINAADGFHLWSEKFDRGLGDIFAVQDEIARTIADKLKAKLAGGVQQPLVKPATDDLEAYQLYLQGRYYWNQRGAGLAKGLNYFEAALKRDPDYALAQAGLAEAYVLIAHYGYARPKDVIPKARVAALRAIELEPRMAEAHSALAFILGVYDRDIRASRLSYERAIELKPTLVAARYWTASLESVCGDHGKGVEVAEEAVRIEPLSLVANTLLAWVGITARSGKSVVIARRVIEMEPRFLIGHWILGVALIAENKFDEGLRELTETIELSNRLPWMVATYGCGLAWAGRATEARAVLEELERRASAEYVPAFLFVMLHAYLGEEAQAVAWLERSIEDNDGALCYFGVVVDWPTPMGIPERYFSPEVRTRFIKRLGLERFK